MQHTGHSTRRLAERVVVPVAAACLFAATCLATAPSSRAATLHVPADYPTIQIAVDAAAGGDVVVVAPGTYSITGQRTYEFLTAGDGGFQTLRAVAFLKSGVAVVSDAGAAGTFLEVSDAGSDVHCLAIATETSAAATLVRGFTFRKPNGEGAALFAREMPSTWNLTVEDCVFEGSEGGYYEGGGIHCLGGGDLTVRRCRFTGSTSSGNRGALHAFSHFNQPFAYLQSLVVEDCDFRDCPNRAVYSWALTTTVRGTDFRSCSESDPFATGPGALLAIFDATIEDCRFEHCADTPVIVEGGSGAWRTVLRRSTFLACSGFAGAARLVTQSATVEDCQFVDCTGTSIAGIAFMFNGPNQVLARRNVFLRVTSPGAFGAVYSSAMNGEVSSNTFLGCSSNGSLGGSALYGRTFHGTLSVHHNIFAGSGGNGAVLLGGDFTEDCNSYWNNAVAHANYPVAPSSVLADPLFCDAVAGDLTLRSDSPCLPPGPAGCGLIGARDRGCGPVGTSPTSWGGIKALYR